jgi:periplasmic mercuric ion binding protein
MWRALSVVAWGVASVTLAVPVASEGVSRTVTLSVPSMNCAACPITVKKALQKVSGVEKVVVTYEPKQAIVTFDDSKTNVETLREATRNAGYPSSVKEAR